MNPPFGSPPRATFRNTVCRPYSQIETRSGVDLNGLESRTARGCCYDLLQRKHAILRNYPVLGHFRYWLESVGPELRQYIVTDNNEERPFSRDQRRWVYASSKLQNNYFGFGSDNEQESSPNYPITHEIAGIRGVSMDRDCVSPAAHTALSDADSLLDFAEQIAAETGLPAGIKSAVGEMRFWRDLTSLIATTGRSVDFVTVDGGEGGTGAAPLVFADRVGLPFKVGFSRVQRAFADQGLHDHVVFIGSGRLGFPDSALVAFSLGCDMVNVGREALLAIGCIQALRCHTNRCPTGITTQSAWLMRGLDPANKSVRVANYIVTLRKELLALSRACGVSHPSRVTAHQIEILDGRFGSRTVADLLGGRGRGVAFDDEPEIQGTTGLKLTKAS